VIGIYSRPGSPVGAFAPCTSEVRTVELGITLGDTSTAVREAAHFDAIRQQVEAAQRNGLTYLLIGQHFLFEGARWLQPVPLLARLAAEVDPQVRLATHVMIGPLYHPVMLAEELATLDVVTEGRLVVGLGLGYLPAEFEVFGVPFEERIERFEEAVALLRDLWTKPRVTFHGRFWSLDDAPTHVHPVQKPHPPLWIGAQSLAGVRRSARLGDAWPITSNIGVEEIRRRTAVYADERRRLGRPVGSLPLRREIFIGRDRDDAMARAVSTTREWFVAMSQLGNLEMDHEVIVSDMSTMVRDAFVYGSPEDCLAAVRAIGDEFPIGPLVTRANWPGMTDAQVIGYLDDLGRELVPALAEYQPCRWLDR
jgi:alkanesulfonate monooxygenase SsuD/methylene tetrahydromethanopterin reductase-like flavin-dependent oxidoreductase (luciferase family)